MHVKRFDTRHMGHLSGWLAIREMPLSVLYDLPEIGYIVFDCEKAIAAAFLRRIEGGFGFIDSAITNPHASASIRDAAMDMVSKAIIGHAKRLKLKKLFVHTVDKNTAERARRMEFVPLKDLVLALKVD